MTTWYAKNLQDYIEIITRISSKEKKKYPLWFRGQEKANYILEPSIYRNFSNGKEGNDINSDKGYGTLWLKEEYRYQHFVARTYDKVASDPESVIEWQEIMQHHFAKTRLMDWSESAVVALNFALEAYMNPSEDHELNYKRRNNSPVVWVLNPIKLNEKVYECFEQSELLIRGGLRDFEDAQQDKIVGEIQNNKNNYFLLNDSVNAGVNGLVSLSGLESLRKAQGNSLKTSLENGNFNPFFYLLLRYYSDGIGVNVNQLPPLAIIHPYHTMRIHDQKGAFTIFPYYNDAVTYIHQKTRVSPYAMENMLLCKGCLDKIILENVWDIKEQLKEMGVRRSHLYPELEPIAKEFEDMKY